VSRRLTVGFEDIFNSENYMNYNQEIIIKNNYRQMLEKCLVDIIREYDSGKSKVNLIEHRALCRQLRNLLNSNLDMYFFRISLLSPTQLKAMVMRMDHALFRQCFVNDEHKQIAYAIQFKMEFDNMEHSLSDILNK
jgi:DNA integrity scanning protein DisA with diadenylate cyclase activity